MTATVTIIRATDAFLYLPVYMAERQNIFARVMADRGIEQKYTFEFETVQKGGDVPAIESVLDRSEHKSEIAIALCDPIEACAVDDPNRLAVIGGLLRRPPFWVINGQGPIHDLSKLPKLNLIIGNDQNMQTANFFAEYLWDKTGRGAVKEPAKFGKEIRHLINARMAEPRMSIAAVTADLLSIARARTIYGDEEVPLTYSFSASKEFEHFVTSGFVTTKRAYSADREAFGVFLEAIKRAIILLHYSEVSTAAICQDISKLQDFSDYSSLSAKRKVSDQALSLPSRGLSEDESAWVAKILHKENLFSSDLAIQQSDWEGAISRRSFPQPKRQHEWMALYNRLVVNGVDADASHSVYRHLFPVRARREERDRRFLFYAAIVGGICGVLALVELELSQLLVTSAKCETWLSTVVQCTNPLVWEARINAVGRWTGTVAIVIMIIGLVRARVYPTLQRIVGSLVRYFDKSKHALTIVSICFGVLSAILFLFIDEGNPIRDFLKAGIVQGALTLAAVIGGLLRRVAYHG